MELPLIDWIIVFQLKAMAKFAYCQWYSNLILQFMRDQLLIMLVLYSSDLAFCFA